MFNKISIQYQYSNIDQYHNTIFIIARAYLSYSLDKVHLATAIVKIISCITIKITITSGLVLVTAKG